jgi:UDP-GlcNAc:undecaprenyl-phosphate GlcNAc-1-phosphate transferase
MVPATAFLIAVTLGLLLTPLGTRVAWAIGFLDHPEARKLHTSATALLGGAVVFASALLAWSAAQSIQHASGSSGPLFLLGGAFVALGIGLWDDRFGMRPSIKMGGQAAAALILLASGQIPDLGMPVALNALVSCVALVALMNAINFLDNMNGVVAGLSAIILAAFAWDSATRGAFGLAAAQLAVSGACVGFLRYNFPRARIFLGDAGSLFLGYCLGASAVLAFQGAPQGWGRGGAILMLAYPAFDLIFVVITRIRDGRKVYEGGKDHSNHRLASVIRCQKKTVLLLWLGGAVLCVSGLAVLKLNQPIPTLSLSALWIILLLWAGVRLSAVPIAQRSANP